jgi:hypothetical protein
MFKKKLYLIIYLENMNLPIDINHNPTSHLSLFHIW